MEEKRLETGLYAWKEICEFHGWKTTGGTYRKAREKDLSTMYSWEKESRKILIKEVYKESTKREDNRGCNGKYSNDIQEILLYILYNDEDERVVRWSINTILEKVNMINKNYIKYRRNMDELSKDINMDKEYIMDFYNYNHKDLRQKVETALKRLESRKLIICDFVTMVNIEEVQIIFNEYGRPIMNDGVVKTVTNKYTRKATEEEKEIILKASRKALKKLKCKDVGIIISKGLYKEYSDIVYKEILDAGIVYYYKAYEIVFSKEDIKKEVVGYLGFEYDKSNLNDNVCKCMIKGANTRHENSLKNEGLELIKSLDEDYSNESHILRMKEDYVSNNEKLVETLVKTI